MIDPVRDIPAAPPRERPAHPLMTNDTLAAAIVRANAALDWIESRQGPLPADSYARIETTVSVVRALGRETTVSEQQAWLDGLRAAHQMVEDDDVDADGNRVIVAFCAEDDDDWPCDIAALLDLLDGREVLLQRRVAALEERAEAADGRVLTLADALADMLLLNHEKTHDGLPSQCEAGTCVIGRQLVGATRESVVDSLAADFAAALSDQSAAGGDE